MDVEVQKRHKHPSARKREKFPPRESRVAHVQISAGTFTFARPANASKTLPTTLTLQVVYVKEVGYEGEDALEWVLLTTEPIDTLEEIVQIVEDYRGRWVVEEYFKALKTGGCDAEGRQLRHLEGLERLMAILAPIAYKVMCLKQWADDKAGLKGSDILEEDELEILKRMSCRKVSESSSGQEVVLAIAALGGHMKRSGPPGYRTIWRGYMRLQSWVEGYRFAQEWKRERCFEQPEEEGAKKRKMQKLSAKKQRLR
jgi:hypothetical protein